jgi:hypothetical protein
MKLSRQAFHLNSWTFQFCQEHEISADVPLAISRPPAVLAVSVCDSSCCSEAMLFPNESCGMAKYTIAHFSCCRFTSAYLSFSSLYLLPLRPLKKKEKREEGQRAKIKSNCSSSCSCQMSWVGLPLCTWKSQS